MGRTVSNYQTACYPNRSTLLPVELWEREKVETAKDCLTPALPPFGGSLEAIKRGLEEALKELRPDPRQQGSGRTLHAFGGNSLLIFPKGGYRCGTGRYIPLLIRCPGEYL